MVTVADQLPDQDELRHAPEVHPTATAESLERPILWDSEEMAIDEECEISFETMSEKAANASQRKPLGRLNDVGEVEIIQGQQGSVSPEQQKDEDNLTALTRKQTVQYGLPPDEFDFDATENLTENELLGKAAVSSPACL